MNAPRQSSAKSNVSHDTVFNLTPRARFGSVAAATDLNGEDVGRFRLFLGFRCWLTLGTMFLPSPKLAVTAAIATPAPLRQLAANLAHIFAAI